MEFTRKMSEQTPAGKADVRFRRPHLPTPPRWPCRCMDNFDFTQELDIEVLRAGLKRGLPFCRCRAEHRRAA